MKNIKKIVWWMLAVVIMIVIYNFSAEKAVDSAGTSKRFIRVLIDIFPFTKDLAEIAKQELIASMDFFIRKCAHFSLYASLGFVLFGAIKYTFLKSVKFTSVCSFLICVLYAISDEIHQYFVQGRACRIYDVAIDAFGSIFGIAVFILFKNYTIFFKNIVLKYRLMK